MKKLAYIAGLLAVMATACSPDKLNTMFADEGTGIRLTPVCTELSTKATIPGEDKYNENTIDRFLYFIYSDAAGTALVTSGESADGQSLFLVLDEYSSLTTPKKGYVYVIANLPEGTVLPETKTVAELKKIALSSSFYTGDAQEGVVNPDNRFVMATESAQEFTLVEHRAVDVKAQLKRVAAKIQLNIDAAKQVTQMKTNPDGTTKPVKEWESVINKMQVYLLWAAKDGTLQGTPLTYSEETKGSYYSTPRYAMFSGGTENSSIPDDAINETTKTYTEHEWQGGALVPVEKTIPIYQVESTPMYSYPISWNQTDAQAPFIKIILPWMGTAINEDGTRTPDSKPTEFYYKIVLPDETALVSNTCYQISIDLAVLGSGADEVPVEINGNYYVVDWNEAETMGGEQTAGRYLKIAQTKFEMYGDQLEIPLKSSHELEVYGVSNEYRYFPGDGETRHLTQHATNYTGTNFTLLPQDLNTVVLKHEMDKDINEFATNGSNAKDVAPITYKFKIRHADNDDYTTEEITVVQYPSIYIGQKTGGNAFLNGYFQYQSAAPNGFSSLTARNYTFTNTSGTTSYGPVRGYRYDNGTGSGSVNSQGYGTINYDGGLPRNLTLVTVSAFPGGSAKYTSTGDPEKEYIIGDPRQSNKSWNSLNDYLSGRIGNNDYQDTPWGAQTISKIKVGSNTRENVIAPAFLLSSRWSRPGGTFPDSREMAEQRCAAYQEAGYPAGRWRLPTEAEIYFVYTLQTKGLVDGLFSNTGTQNYGYYASSGRVFDRFGVNGETSYRTRFTPNPISGRDVSVRCVYDYWYWENDKVSENNFTPKP